MTPEEIVSAMETVQTSLAQMRDVKNPRTSAELCLVSLCSDAGGDSVHKLRARLSRLEEQVERGIPAAPQVERQPVQEEYPPLPEDWDEPGIPASPIETTPRPIDHPVAADEPVPTTPVEESTIEPEPENKGVKDSSLWPMIRSQALQSLPIDVRISLEDGDRVRGYVEGNILYVEPQITFLVKRLQKQDVVQRLAEAAMTVCGREIRVQVRERQPELRQTRSLDELKQFKEVHFVTENK
jgi:hypothetical protein